MPYTVTIWGARGSIPTPGPATTRYGGNTACVSVQGTGVDKDCLVVLDAGTGIRPLGRELLAAQQGPLNVDLLVTHTHWDHIQGLPFFGPFFSKQNSVRIWGPKQGDVDLDVILRQQMHPVVFPVPLDALAAELTVQHVAEGEFEIDGFAVRSMRLRHPGNTLGYRLTPVRGGASMAYVTDNELGPGGDYKVGRTWRKDLIGFLSGVDVMIHDAMYAPEAMDHHRGWGHSSYLEAVTLAAEADVKRLVLFHHRPDHDDNDMDAVVSRSQGEAAKLNKRLQVVAAMEGLQLTL